MSEQKPRELWMFKNDGVARTKEEISDTIVNGPPAIWHQSDFTKYVIAEDYDRLREAAEKLARTVSSFAKAEIERLKNRDMDCCDELSNSLDSLAAAVSEYCLHHDVYGDNSIAAGRAWDRLRHQVARAKFVLNKYYPIGKVADE